jgi:ABC-type multidrug transport system fused ATPase/permease subunit
VGRTEKELLERDDRVRANIEDLLRAAPEVQVGNLFGPSRDYMRDAQEQRETVFNRVAWLDARLNAVQGIAALAGMASLFVVTLYFLTAQSPDVGVALVPIIIKALPELFANTSALVLQRLSMVRSQTSIQRLLEFDNPGEAETEEIRPAAQALPVRFQDVSYQYPSPSGVSQGGIHEVSTDLHPGRWIAVVGPTGAGKSTFLQLLLGRVQPQTGAVFQGATSLTQFSAARRASLMSFMPQRLSILDTTLLANITFGRPDADARRLSSGDLAVIEAAGLADLCRRKALHMAPSSSELRGPVAEKIEHLRETAQSRLKQLGVAAQKYGGPTGDPQHWVLEHLLKGRCDRSEVLNRLLSPAARRPLRRIIGTPLGNALVAHGQRTLQSYRSILRLPTYQQFSRLAPFFLDERTWTLWTQTLTAADASVQARAESAMLMSVALTSSGGAYPWTAKSEWTPGIAQLRRFFSGLWVPFVDRQLHPHMTWRENLLFASVDVRNDRVDQRLEQMLLELVEAEGLKDELTRIGLGFHVGRAGARLSGGQCQLVALCRTLLRGTPIVVLDEPTSALDPMSRARIAALLHSWKTDRIIVTSSHDPEFVRQADEVRLFERGRLVRSGPFDVLLRESDTLRDLLRLQTPAAIISAVRRTL